MLAVLLIAIITTLIVHVHDVTGVFLATGARYEMGRHGRDDERPPSDRLVSSRD